MTGATNEDVLARLVDAATEGSELTLWLNERLPLYDGRGANQVTRMRGYILAAFERTGLPDEALPYVLEELESGHSAYLVAAAAKAVRGLATPAASLPGYLLKAAWNIRQRDDAVTFDAYQPDWPAANPTSALREIFRTLAWLGTRGVPIRKELEELAAGPAFSPAVAAELNLALAASAPVALPSPLPVRKCCASAPLPQLVIARPPGVAIRLQDQEGRQVAFEEFFAGKPAIVVFFYTRCNNPNKCSLTITKLAHLQQALDERGLDVKTAAITYDPDFDLPDRLKGYGLARSVRFAVDHRFFRAHTGFAELSERWHLGVNYSESTVNHHRIELLILDATGRVAHQHTRAQWSPEDVLAIAETVSHGMTAPALG